MIISLVFISLGVFLLIFSYFVVIFNKNKVLKKENNGKYCILIPARDESLVIENLLISIENQTKKVADVYVIVEDKNDKTVDITLKHNMNIIYRKDLSKKRKGYALDEAIKEILKNNIKYDAYFIFDADNILDKDYILNMEKSINKGYDIGIGYRNTKNSNTLVSAASSLTFSMINTVFNERKCKYNNNLIISGTGYYIRGYLIEKWGGFPFNCLTEDYELTLYCTLNNLTCTYNQKAIFYDEQPDSFKVSIKQRTRWVKGYFEARSKYILKIIKSLDKNNFASKINEIIGVWSYIFILLGLILYLIFNFSLLSLGLIISIIYLILMLFTIIMILKEDYLKMDIKMKIKVIFYNPLFLISYVWCLILAIFKKNITWDKIEHNKK